MKQTRRSILRSASAIAAALAGAGTVSGQSEYPTWDSNTAYSGGDRVVYQGTIFEAQWWTRGQEPAASAAVWEEIGPADGGGGDDGGNDGGSTPSYPAWDAGATYTGGDRVVYDGYVWEAQWWSKGDEPGASQWGPWEQIEEDDGGSGGGGGGTELNAVVDLSATTITAGESVTLDASGSSGDIASYEWTVGSDGPFTGAQNTVTLDTAGSYTVTLTVTAADGTTDSAQATLTVESGGGTSPGMDQIFSPYAYNGADQAIEASLSHVTLAFVTDGGGGGYSFNYSQSEVQRLQDNGIDVAVSVGGYNTRTPSMSASSAEQLKDTYVDLVDTYGIDRVDIDDEVDNSNYEQRNEALAMLQDERPNVDVSYTIMMWGESPTPKGENIVRDAAAKGVDIRYVNPMVMDNNPIDSSAISGAAANIESLLADLYPDLSEEERYNKIGVTPMIGVNNNDGDSIFTPEEARNTLQWAQNNNLGMLTFWSLGRDRPAPSGEENVTSPNHSGLTDIERFEFSNIFQQIEN